MQYQKSQKPLSKPSKEFVLTSLLKETRLCCQCTSMLVYLFSLQNVELTNKYTPNVTKDSAFRDIFRQFHKNRLRSTENIIKSDYPNPFPLSIFYFKRWTPSY